MQKHKPKKAGMAVELKVGESLTLDLGAGETVLLRPGIDTRRIRLTLESKHGQVARFRVHAADAVKVGRPELEPMPA